MRRSVMALSVAGLLLVLVINPACKSDGGGAKRDSPPPDGEGGTEGSGDGAGEGGDANPTPPSELPVDDGGDAADGGAADDGTADGGDTGDGVTPPVEDPEARFNLTVEATKESIQAGVIDAYCIKCHSGTAPAAKLDLTDIDRYAKGEHGIGGYHGHLISPGRPNESMLYIVIKSTRLRDQMPPATSGVPRVKEHQLDAVKQWIASLPSAGNDDDEPGIGDGGGDEPGGDDEPGDDDGGEPGEPR